MVWRIHAVVISHNLELEEARKKAQDIIKNKNRTFMRDETNTYRFRNISKQKFSKFRSDKINDDITIVYGQLKPEYKNIE